MGKHTGQRKLEQRSLDRVARGARGWDAIEAMDRETYTAERGRVSDDELRAAFIYVLKPEVPDSKFCLALQLFAEMEARDRAYGGR